MFLHSFGMYVCMYVLLTVVLSFGIYVFSLFSVVSSFSLELVRSLFVQLFLYFGIFLCVCLPLVIYGLCYSVVSLCIMLFL